MAELTAAERAAILDRRSKDERVLIYRNLLQCVPVWKVMQTFQKSEKDVMDIFRAVSRVLEEYCFRRKLPLNYIDGIATAQRHKGMLLPLLPKINLDKQPALSRIMYEGLTKGTGQEAIMDLLRNQIKK